MKKLFLIVAVALLSGCGYTPEETQQNLDSPQYVGEVGGRKLYCATVGRNYDRVYFFKPSVDQPITISESAGKTRKVVVIVDGVSYTAEAK